MRDAITNGKGLGEADGVYSHAVWAGQTLYLTGACGITDELRTHPDMKKETANAMKWAEAVLATQGLTFENVVSARVYITDMDSFDDMNESYRSFFKKPYPARATVQVAKLADGAHIEILFIAYDPKR